MNPALAGEEVLASVVDVGDLALEGLVEEGGVFAFRLHEVGREGGGAGGVEEDEFGEVALFDFGIGEFDEAAGFVGVAFDEEVPAEGTFGDVVVEEGGEGGFEAGDAEGGAGEVLIFFELGVGGVVGGDDVEDAVDETLQERGVVGSGAQGRVHFVVGVVVADVLVIEDEVVGGDLAGDADAAVFGAANGVHAERGGDVLDVEVDADVFGEANVAGDADFFADGRDALEAEAVGDAAFMHAAFTGEFFDFAMAGEGEVELFGVLHGAAENLGVADGVAIVGEVDDAAAFHAGDAGEFFTFATFGDGAGGEDGGPDAGFFAGDVEDVLDGGGAVDGGVGIGLENHAGDAAVDGGFGAGEDGFFVLASGFAGVDVDVEEGGEEDLTGAVDDGGV